MDAREALTLLRADLIPDNVRMYCRSKQLPASKVESLTDLADELSRGSDTPDHAAAFRAVWFIVDRDIGEALACAFGAPTHAMAYCPYCTIVEGCLGRCALSGLLADTSYYTPYYSASCAPSGRLLEQLEALLTDAVVKALSPPRTPIGLPLRAPGAKLRR